MITPYITQAQFDKTFPDTAPVDQGLAAKMMTAIQALNRLNDGIGDRALRQQIDEHLVRAFLLVRDGHERNINGGGR